jgi:hypothetical protein
MSMKPLLLAAAFLAVTALPASAETVELVCNGWLHQSGEFSTPSAMNGMHLLVGAKTVVVSGGNHAYPTTYAINKEESDAANLVFSSGRWFGRLNRYSGELWLMREPQADGKHFKGRLEAKCGKADPLF